MDNEKGYGIKKNNCSSVYESMTASSISSYAMYCASYQKM